MTRRMKRSTFMFFLLYVCDLHNEREESKLKRGHYYGVATYNCTFVVILLLYKMLDSLSILFPMYTTHRMWQCLHSLWLSVGCPRTSLLVPGHTGHCRPRTWQCSRVWDVPGHFYFPGTHRTL